MILLPPWGCVRKMVKRVLSSKRLVAGESLGDAGMADSTENKGVFSQEWLPRVRRYAS